MPIERFYVNDPLEQGSTVFLKNEEFHHLAHVVRLKKGEVAELINGKGTLAKSRLEELGNKQAAFSILSLEKEEKPPYELILAQALPRQPRLEYILEKSVELGVTKLWLFPGMLSEKKEFSSSQIERINHIIISATKQCGRLYLPELTLSPPLLSWKNSTPPKNSFFGDTAALDSSSFLKQLSKLEEKSLLMAIGPEKGFHIKETVHMRESLGMQGVFLHANILRTDTAAIFSLSLASAFLIEN